MASISAVIDRHSEHHQTMPFTCRAMIFDLDGVLVDSEAAVEQRWRQWAEEHDIPFEEIEAVYHGRPAFEVIREVAPHLDVKTATDRMTDTTNAAPEQLSAFAGSKDLLESLPEDRWTIATSGRTRTATNRLSQVGLPVPDSMVTADDVENGKPAPDAYRLAAERLGIAPEDCVVLEDAPAGVEAAQRAGATVVGVATATSPDALSAADAVVDTIADVETRRNGTDTLSVRCRNEARRTA